MKSWLLFDGRPRWWSAFAGVGVSLCFGVGWIGSTQFLVPSRRPLEPRHLAAIEDPEEFGLALSEGFVATATDGMALECLLITDWNSLFQGVLISASVLAG